MSAPDAAHRDLVAWLGHDLYGPLAALDRLAATLRERRVLDPLAVAATISAATQRLSAVVDDLVDVSTGPHEDCAG